MVGVTGIEPVTPAVSRQCSTAELHTHVFNMSKYDKTEYNDF